MIKYLTTPFLIYMINAHICVYLHLLEGAKGMTKEYRFWKLCKLKSCGKKFGTNREWQDFHEPECRLKYQILIRRERSRILAKVSDIEEENKEIKKRLKELERR